MNTAVFILRSLQLGLKISDLEQMNYGFVVDLMIENGNDQSADDYACVATQEDFDRF